MDDEYKDAIAKIIEIARQPLETKEVQERLAKRAGIELTRTRLVYRLNDLRGEGRIRGKSVGSGKGVWIWWADTQLT